MTTDDAATHRNGAATSEFETRLTDLLLTSFADGADVAGHWRIETPTGSVPDWSIEIICEE
ncbi:hypothetical protein [Natranaeroarchaeum sulfidigenes]|uniref:Uncharacterized protein n=1 Tax=Natranaeroarchaeum sulfidigenes TaxID=2784880 RepID=A0A897MZM6_9EURY|nr:hypothetical protein [Natranaeroarchaeum sulfidigenes]QSG03835.1 Uncharacterized protein AArcS_2639 [Natranaeroarchaeum sulfidigenes]